jgi:hypothetical protein
MKEVKRIASFLIGRRDHSASSRMLLRGINDRLQVAAVAVLHRLAWSQDTHARSFARQQQQWITSHYR